MKIEIDPCALRSALERAAKCASDDTTRPHLFQVRLETVDKSGVRFLATNGHVLVNLRAPATVLEEGSTQIPLDAVTLASKCLPRARFKTVKEVRKRVDNSPQWLFDDAGLTGPGITCAVPRISEADALFPPWDQVIPKQNDGEQGSGPIGIKGRYLKLAGEVFPGGVEFRRMGVLDPVTFRGVDTDLEITGELVVMPMRI